MAFKNHGEKTTASTQVKMLAVPGSAYLNSVQHKQ